MFVPCPHCGFLIALIVADGGPPQRCPRCDAVLADTAQAHGPAPTVEPAGSPDASWILGDEGESGIEMRRRDIDEPLRADGPMSATPVEHADDRAIEADKGGIGAKVIGSASTVAIADIPAARSSTKDSKASQPRRPGNRSPAPSFARAARPRRKSGPRWPGLLVITALSLVLAVQLTLAQRAELAASARWRPLIGGLCAALQCTLPPWREPDAWTMLARSVQPASGKDGVLQVQASFRNDAHWPQPWPSLLLSLSDINGQTVARRAFLPGDYHAAGGGSAAELAPGQSASVAFELVEPAMPIVAFSFEFR